MFARIDYDVFTVASVCAGSRPALNAPRIRVSSITNSSLEVKAGSLFVPLADKRDGHEFIEDALRQGASAFFLKRGHPAAKKLGPETLSRAIIVDDPLLALGTLAHFHRKRFAPLVVAVTGSNGKTTTKEMLAQIFRKALGKQCVFTEKNYNNHIGLPFSIFSIGKDTRVAVLEMGMNHAGEIGYLSRIAEPHVAVISSIGHAHIEFLKSLKNIALAKAEILEGMHSGGLLCVPEKIAELATVTAAAKRKKITVRRVNPTRRVETQNFASLHILSQSPKGFSLSLGKEEIFFPHANPVWVSNLALATAVAREAGLEPGVIAAAVNAFKPPAGRMQLKPGYFKIIDDGYNANPDSAIASIASALQIADGKRLICVFGDFKELGKFSRSLHAWTGKEAAKMGVAEFYGVGNDMRHAVRAFRKAGGKQGFHFKREAAGELVRQLQREAKNSVLLIKGSRSMRMEEIVALLGRK